MNRDLSSKEYKYNILKEMYNEEMARLITCLNTMEDECVVKNSDTYKRYEQYVEMHTERMDVLFNVMKALTKGESK